VLEYRTSDNSAWSFFAAPSVIEGGTVALPRGNYLAAHRAGIDALRVFCDPFKRLDSKVSPYYRVGSSPITHADIARGRILGARPLAEINAGVIQR
jgi:hypothetical protein